MNAIRLDLSGVRPFLDEQPETLDKKVLEIHHMIHDRTGKGSGFLGWLDLPDVSDNQTLEGIKKIAADIRGHSEVLVVIGIGGSYLGAKAGLEFVKKPFSTTKPEVVFAGHQMSAPYLSGLLTYLDDKSYAINVISKSGTTTEPAIAFRTLKKHLENKVGRDEAARRIIATTDRQKGALHTLAKTNGYDMLVIPDDVGGRFSVLTAVGLLPLAVAGVDIDAVMKGAKEASERYRTPELANNPAYLYATTRHLLYQQGKKIELMVGYEPALTYFNEWWKQLFGESEGKTHKGLFVASAAFSTDLHSLGQYIQDGERHLFETTIHVDDPGADVIIESETDDLDELNYLAGKTVSHVNKQAMKGTMMAHQDGGVPNLLITIPTLDAEIFGHLIYFFEKACAMSAYLLGVNPFDQPGVEAYKTNMFALLGKKGYEHIMK
jgi:glucose-6-phosphate isomerase